MHAAGGQITQTDAMAQPGMPGHQATHPDLDVVRVRTERQQVDVRDSPHHRVQPNTWSVFSGAPVTARVKTFAATNAAVRDSPDPPNANRWRG